MNRTRVDLLVSSTHLITMAPGDRALRHDHAIAIDDDVIVDIGPAEELSRLYEPDRTEALGNTILMPGMINTHGHLPMIGYCGKMPDAIPFDEILFRHMIPVEREFVNREGFVYLCSLLGARELVLSGVTTTAEMYYNAADSIRAFQEIGIRGIIGETVISEFPSPTARSADQALSYIRDTFAMLPRTNGLVEIAVAPHSAYSCNDETLVKCRNLAVELGIPILMHAQETPEEMEKGSGGNPAPMASFYRSRPEVSDLPMVHLEKRGFFDAPRVLLAHCIYLSGEEIEALAKNNVGASYNGMCNTQIGLGIAPLIEMQKKGVSVGIGTDGPLTNDRIDVLSQLLPLLCFQRHRHSSSHILSCYDVLRMATLEGARALGIDFKTGSLEKGKKADIIGINLSKTPRASLYMNNDAVYTFLVKYVSAHFVDFCLIDGRVPKVPDESSVMARLEPLLGEIKSWEPPAGALL